jgi:hypothetical protein
MPDRYEDGIRALQLIEPPDQWDDIHRRATGGLIVPLDEGSVHRRRRWPTLLAAAAVLVLVLGAAALVLRDGNNVTTNPTDPGLRPPIDGPEPLDDQPSTTPPSTTEQPSTTDEPVTDDLGECPVELGLTTSTAPAGWSATMVPAADALPPDPPEGVDPGLAGLFPGPTSADNVFVIAGLPGLQDDVFERYPGPVPGVDAAIAPWQGGWYVEVFVPHPSGDCWVTLQAIGMKQDEAIQFVRGLEAS